MNLTYTRSSCNLVKNISNSLTRTSSQDSLSLESRRLVQVDDKIMMKILSEKQSRHVGFDGFPPIQGTRMIVRSVSD